MLIFCCQERGTYFMNTAISFMYRSGYWIRASCGHKLAMWLLYFLQSYGTCAKICLREGKCRFSLIPKTHSLHHVIWELQAQAEKNVWIENPLAFSVQMQEDYIGRPSRLSRRVSARQMIRHVVDRSLVCSMLALEDTKTDMRGLV